MEDKSSDKMRRDFLFWKAVQAKRRAYICLYTSGLYAHRRHFGVLTFLSYNRLLRESLEARKMSLWPVLEQHSSRVF